MSRFRLDNVRLSFPNIFAKSTYIQDGVSKEGKYEATFLFSKENAKMKEMIDAHIEEAIAASPINKVASDKRCLKDGDESEYDGYENVWSFKGGNRKRPQILDRDGTPLVEDDGKPYAGCYVNAIVDIWIQNNTYGKRVNANLYGIQFLKDGEAFGSGPIDVTGEFDISDEF